MAPPHSRPARDVTEAHGRSCRRLACGVTRPYAARAAAWLFTGRVFRPGLVGQHPAANPRRPRKPPNHPSLHPGPPGLSARRETV